MKNLKSLGVLIIALGFFACEHEPVEDSISEEVLTNNEIPEKYIITNQSILNTKNVITPTEFKIIESEEDFNSNCNDTEVISDYTDIHDGLVITLHETDGITSFGAFFADFTVSGQHLIEIFDYATNSIIYNHTIDVPDVYWGITANSKIDIIITTNADELLLFNWTYGFCDYLPEITDTDGDGVPDDEDFMPNSNMEETVMIDGCDSSIDNIALGDGIMLSDKIDELEAGNYRNRGKYVRATAQYLAGLVDEGVITNEEKDAIMTCAGSSSIG